MMYWLSARPVTVSTVSLIEPIGVWPVSWTERYHDFADLSNVVLKFPSLSLNLRTVMVFGTNVLMWLMKSVLSLIPPDTTRVSNLALVATLLPWWTTPSRFQPLDVLSASTAMYVPASRFETVSTPLFGLPPPIESADTTESL